MHMSNKLSLVLIKDGPDIRALMPHQKWPQQSRSNVRRYTNDPLRLHDRQRVVAELADANQQLKERSTVERVVRCEISNYGIGSTNGADGAEP